MVSVALRKAELEQLRRSIVMIPDHPSRRVLTKSAALDLIEELAALYESAATPDKE